MRSKSPVTLSIATTSIFAATGKPFDPDKPKAYLDGFTIRKAG